MIRIGRISGLALGAAVLFCAGPADALAATGDVIAQQSSYTAATTGASLSGKFTHLTDASGVNWYNVSFTLKDTGNDAKTVYAKWRYQVLVSNMNGIFWVTTAAKTFGNALGYGKTTTGLARQSQAQLNTIAAGYSTLPAIKARVQVAVCRDAATDNCSGWQWVTWTTYPQQAFIPGFLCNMNTMVVDLQGVSGFVHPNYIPNGAFTLYATAHVLESTDWNFGTYTVRSSEMFRIVYPMGLGSSISFVYRASDPTNTPISTFSYSMTAGKYYALLFDVWFASAAAPIETFDYPAGTFGRYSIQNAAVQQGYAGDWRCVAR
jgi:hypothetical protein